MSLAAVTYALAQRFGSQSRKLVMLAVADGADDSGRNSWQSIDTLAHKAECSARTVQRILRSLEASEHLAIRWGAGPRGTNIVHIKFQKLPPGFSHPWEGRHGVTPAVQKPTSATDRECRGNCSDAHDTLTGGATTEARQTAPRGDNGGPSLSPEQRGTLENCKERRERGKPTHSLRSCSTEDLLILRTLFRVIPEAPRTLDDDEAKAFLTIRRHLDALTEDDWTGLRAWFAAPDEIRGRTLWPRTRLEFLRNLFETLTQMRRWWGRPDTNTRARRWWAKTQQPPKPATPTTNELTTEEALKILRE